MPANAYLGLYIDCDGPSGIIKDLPADETAYFQYLSMYYPYVLKQTPDTFVVQFGGGISTAVALKSGSSHVTVAEGNPAVLTAFREDKGLRAFTGDVLNNPKVTVIDYERPPLPTPRTATTSSTCGSPTRPACRTPAASPSSRSTPTRARR